MLSAFIHKSSSATAVGFSIFIVGFVVQAWIFHNFLTSLKDYPSNWKKGYSISLCSLFVWLQLVSQAGFPYNSGVSKTIRYVWSLFPPNPFAQALAVLSEATSTPQDDGVRWSKRGECAPNDDDCVITIVCTNLTFKSLHYTICFR